MWILENSFPGDKIDLANGLSLATSIVGGKFVMSPYQNQIQNKNRKYICDMSVKGEGKKRWKENCLFVLSIFLLPICNRNIHHATRIKSIPSHIDFRILCFIMEAISFGNVERLCGEGVVHTCIYGLDDKQKNSFDNQNHINLQSFWYKLLIFHSK